METQKRTKEGMKGRQGMNVKEGRKEGKGRDVKKGRKRLEQWHNG